MLIEDRTASSPGRPTSRLVPALGVRVGQVPRGAWGQQRRRACKGTSRSNLSARRPEAQCHTRDMFAGPTWRQSNTCDNATRASLSAAGPHANNKPGAPAARVHMTLSGSESVPESPGGLQRWISAMPFGEFRTRLSVLAGAVEPLRLTRKARAWIHEVKGARG